MWTIKNMHITDLLDIFKQFYTIKNILKPFLSFLAIIVICILINASRIINIFNCLVYFINEDFLN